MLKNLFNKKQMKNQKGLTLIELLAVIVVLAIISAIAIPAIGNIIDNTRYNAAKADAINVLNAANMYFTDEPDETTVTVETLLNENYLDSSGYIPYKKQSISSGTGISQSTVEKIDNEAKLTTTVFWYTYSIEKPMTLKHASISDINNDKQKGSADTAKQIPKKK